jgi:hypothetical protein
MIYKWRHLIYVKLIYCFLIFSCTDEDEKDGICEKLKISSQTGKESAKNCCPYFMADSLLLEGTSSIHSRFFICMRGHL